MLHSVRLFAMAAVLVISIPLASQEVFHPANVGFARFSYVSNPAVHGPGPENICFAVSSSGEYRIVRQGMGGMHGKLTDDDLQKFKTLIRSEEFRSLSGNHGGLIRQESESFTAEIPWTAWQEHGRTQRFQWLNADGVSPFPVSAVKVIEWMKSFIPRGGEPFDYAEYPDVCPFGGLRYVQPSVAESRQP